MITLENIFTRYENYAADHKVIKSCFIGDPWDELSGAQSIRYPMTFAVLGNILIDGNKRTITLTIYMCDKVLKGGVNKRKIVSDCELLCLDSLVFFKNFEQQSNGDNEWMTVTEQATIEDYYDSFDDEVTGCKYDLQIELLFDWDYCATATKILDPSDEGGFITQDNGAFLLQDNGAKIKY